MQFELSWDDLIGHVKEFPSECLTYLLAQQRKGELFANPLKFVSCAAAIISYVAGWIDSRANPDDVIGDATLTEEQLADAVEFCQSAGIDVPAGGFIANMILTQLVSALIKQAMLWIDEQVWPQDVTDAVRKLLVDLRDAFAKRV